MRKERAAAFLAAVDTDGMHAGINGTFYPGASRARKHGSANVMLADGMRTSQSQIKVEVMMLHAQPPSLPVKT